MDTAFEEDQAVSYIESLIPSDPDRYKIKQENGRRRENKVHSLSLSPVRLGTMMQREGEHR
jgi:hypothetical protein